jgi:preprotein translocase subunit SecA
MEDRLSALRQIPEAELEGYEEDVAIFYRYMDEMHRVRDLGGLHVIGSERHEARRIDNQLRGRAARQGDPGSSRFFLSLEDDLMRLFGGSQVEGLLSRLKVDEDVPIESGLIGKMVESSQGRVEGANFDVRKHLLEYDDVLNSQRERIYAQRDRIFDKEDLREDVTEMLRVEVGRRVKEGLADPEGPWKLMAYLDEIQPPIDSGGVTHPSFPLKLMMDEIGMPDTADALKGKLLGLARDALEAWHDHLRGWAETLIQRSAMSFENQYAERKDLIDTYHDVSAELSALVHVPLRLSSQLETALAEGSSEAARQIEEQTRNTLMQIFIRRLILTFEQRLNDTWDLKASELMDGSWDSVSETLIAKVDDTLQRRAEFVLGDDGEIAHDLEANNDLLAGAVENRGKLLRLLLMMTQGRVISFDEQSHQRKVKATLRLTYAFLAARMLEKIPVETIQQNVLEHLGTAQDALCRVWGQDELDRLEKAGKTLGDLSADWQRRVIAVIGDSVFDRIKGQPVGEIEQGVRTEVMDVIGRFAQNRLYRELLLSSISELWVEYLTQVEALRVSVRMEAYGQRDPLVQYKGQASEMFGNLLSDIRAGVIDKMFRARLVNNEQLKQIQEKARQGAGQAAVESESKKKKGRKRH